MESGRLSLHGVHHQNPTLENYVIKISLQTQEKKNEKKISAISTYVSLMDIGVPNRKIWWHMGLF